MPQATERRSLKYLNVPFVISSTAGKKALVVGGKPVSFTTTKDNRYHTIHLPHAEFKDLETMAHALIEVFPSLGKK